MCNILIAETNKLKIQASDLASALEKKDIESRAMRKKNRDQEQQMRTMQASLDDYKSVETRAGATSSEEFCANYQPTELTSKATLRRFVEELNNELGKEICGGVELIIML